MADVRPVLDAARRQLHLLQGAKESVNVDVLEHGLLHLEMSDRGFERYGLVRQCRALVASHAADFLDQDTPAAPEGEPEVVNTVVRRILESSAYGDMKKVFVATTVAAAQEIQFQDDISPQEQAQKSLEEDFFEGLDSDEDTELDDLGESFLGLLPPGAELRRLVKSLGPQNTPAVRIEALHALARLSPGDLVGSEHWGFVKTQLLAALLDSDEAVFRETLELHLRIFNTGVHVVLRELFLHFSGHVRAMARAGMTAQSGPLDLRDEGVRRVVTQTAVLAGMAAALPRSWVRMGERSISELVESMIAVCWPGPTVRMLALVDPRASWFRAWMTGQLARAHVFASLEHSPAVITALLDSLLALRTERRSTGEASGPSQSPPRLSGGLATASAAALGASPRAVVPPLGTAPVPDIELFLYSERQLSYLAAMHNACVVAELLLYRRGRALFAPTVVDDFLEMLAAVVCTGSRNAASEDCAYFASGVLAGDLLRRTVSHTLPAQHLALPPRVLAVLLGPIYHCLHSSPRESLSLSTSNRSAEADAVALAAIAYNPVLLDIADIFGLLAMYPAGRAALLALPSNTDEPAAAAVGRLLSLLLAAVAAQQLLAVSLADLVRGLLSVCRQLYSTHDGLTVFTDLQLPEAIVGALSAGVWPELLADSLLNFAWTPRGAASLSQLRHLEPCALQMLDRFRAKVQVSKYEKFGYGAMVAELAASRAGLASLQRCGFVDFMLAALAAAAEGHEDYSVPRGAVASKDVRKTLGYIATILASGIAASSLLSEAQPHEHTTANFLRSLTQPSSSSVFPALHEPAAVLRLRVLMVLVASLDALLLLEATSGCVPRLLAEQAETWLERDGVAVPLVTPCALLRNRILVAATVSGGPAERLLPSVDDLAAPLFASLPPPGAYFCPSPPATRPLAVPSSLVNTHDAFWALLRQDVDHSVAGRVALQEALLGLVSTRAEQHPLLALAPIALNCAQASTMDNVLAEQIISLAADRAGQYGVQLGLGGHGLRDVVQTVLRASHTALPSRAAGADWFAATIVLMTQDAENACKVLSSLSCLPGSLAWPRRANGSFLYAVAAHWIGAVLTAEVPLVAGAMRLAGIACARVVLPWLQQCFWNVLDWPLVCQYVAGCAIEGPAFVVFFCVTLFAHLQADIIAAAQQQRLLDLLLASPLAFSMQSHIDLMASLREKYQKFIDYDVEQLLAKSVSP